MKIDFVIPVRNRDNERIKRCVDGLQTKFTNKIHVIDYGSEIPVKLDNCEVVRINTKNIWNKAHALNIGVKRCKSEYIGFVDCDMFIGKNFLTKAKPYLSKSVFVMTRKVRRILPEVLDWGLPSSKLKKISNNWFAKIPEHYHEAVGGIQIFHREWIHMIRGCDETLTFWGGIDNDIYERAIRTGLTIIDLNHTIYHQEHKLQKEQNLPFEQQQQALELRKKRRAYLTMKATENINVGPEKWGLLNKHQQNK